LTVPPGFDPDDLPRPGDPLVSSEAAWLHDITKRIAAARGAGNTAEVDRLLSYVEAEAGTTRRLVLEQIIDVVARVQRGETVRQKIGAHTFGTRLCDFCAGTDPCCYYPFSEFSLAGAGGEWESGDRMYACATCRSFVDGGDWKGLRAWVGESARSAPVKLLWYGFRRNRTTTGAIEFPPGTDPEAGR
jgi:hypothetical protein